MPFQSAAGLDPLSNVGATVFAAPGRWAAAWVSAAGERSRRSQFERDGHHDLVARRNEPRAPGLTFRERKVVAWAARGYSNLEISFEMHLSEVTVAAHLATAAGKLGLESREALVQAAAAFVDVEPGFD